MSKELAERVLTLEKERKEIYATDKVVFSSDEDARLDSIENHIYALAVDLAKAYLSLLEEKEKGDKRIDDLHRQIQIRTELFNNVAKAYGLHPLTEGDEVNEQIAAAQQRKTE